MKSFISLEDSIDILKSIKINIKIEKVNLIQGINRVLASDVYSNINNPPFNKSAMDGYALNTNKTIKEGTILKVIGVVYSGQVFDGHVGVDETVKIMTGAKIPNNCSAVIKNEDVIIDGNYIKLNKDVYKNDNICQIGEDISKGQLLIKKHTKLNYANIGILASSGIDEILVYKIPKIALLTTGDEVIDVDQKLEDGKIYNSNKYSILSRLLELGYKCEIVNHVSDEYEKIGKKIEELSSKVDLIITTGGASVGDKDLIEKAINYIGGEILFNKVNIKPGSAVLASQKDNTVIISLSGNPNAALTTFELLLKPMLRKLSGNDEEFIKREVAIINQFYNKKSKVRRFIRGKTFIEDGIQMVSIIQKNSGNGILSSTIGSNCLIEIQKGNEELKKGDKVTIIKL